MWGRQPDFELNLLKKQFSSLSIPREPPRWSYSNLEASYLPHPSPHLPYVVLLEFGLQLPPVRDLALSELHPQVSLDTPELLAVS